MSKYTEMGKKKRKPNKYIGVLTSVLFCLPILINVILAIYYKQTSQIPPERYGLIYLYLDIFTNYAIIVPILIYERTHLHE